MADNESIETQLARVDERQKVDSANIEKIMTNHLPHLQAGLNGLEGKIDKLSLRIAYFSGGLAVIMVALQIWSQYR